VKVLFASVEVTPFAWAGGMGEVAGSLPKALRELGVDIRVIMPQYPGVVEKAGEVRRAVDSCLVHMPTWVTGCAIDEARLPGSEVPIYFVEHEQYFGRDQIYGPPGGSYPDNLERFVFFSRAVIEARAGIQWQPDIIHLNDWHTALIALYQRSWGLDFRSVYTGHQFGPAFHGTFPASGQAVAGIDLGRPEVRRFVRNGAIDLARAGLALSDAANTVSERYAAEVAQEGSEEDVWDLVRERGDRFCGILNGIDTEAWNPATDTAPAAHYSAADLSGKQACKAALQARAGLEERPDVPLIAMVSRLDALKGFDLVCEALPHLRDAQFVFLGSGDVRYAQTLRYAATTRPDVAAFLEFDPQLARSIYAGADIFLMPSRREPAGLAQMMALAYGTIPVVHKTGGLADTVAEDPAHQNGFVFEAFTTENMIAAVARALRAYRDRGKWQALMRRAMACDFSWRRSAERYLELYRRALL
jgi:starch synthase